MQVRDHLLELGESKIGFAGETAIGGEEAEGVVAPEVGEALVQQVVVVDEIVDGKKLDRGDAERLDVLDHLRLDQTAKCPL